MKYWQHVETGIAVTTFDYADLSGQYYEISKEDYEVHAAAQPISEYDKFTGSLNRSAFVKYLSENVEHVSQSQEELFLLYADIDHMAQFNHQNGHALGDELLRRFVVSTIPMLGEQQKLFRVGGDEFAIVSLSKTLREVALLAQQICDFARTNLAPPQPNKYGSEDGLDPVKISVSIGIAKLEKDMTADTLFHSADEQSYKAKGSGRGCVYIDNHKYDETTSTH